MNYDIMAKALKEQGIVNFSIDMENGNVVLEDDTPFDAAIFNARCEELVADIPWARIRRKRNALLAETDYIINPDYPCTNKDEFETYREALRNITNAATPEDVVFPTKPEVVNG
jgi:hypothetical protein